MPWKPEPYRQQYSHRPQPVERLIAAICYLTMGLAGILYIAVQGKECNSAFFRFHFLQSILVGIMAILFKYSGDIMGNILGGIFGLIPGLNPGTIMMVVAGAFTLIGALFLLLSLYGLIFAGLGKFAEIPVISKLVRQQLR